MKNQIDKLQNAQLMLYTNSQPDLIKVRINSTSLCLHLTYYFYSEIDFGIWYAMGRIRVVGKIIKCVSYARQQIAYLMHAKTPNYIIYYNKHVHIIFMPK